MDFEQHLKGISIMRVLLYITKDKVLIFHHFRFGSFDLVGCVAELNVQYMHLQQFCTFAFQCVCIFAFFLESFDLVGGVAELNLQYVPSAILHFCISVCLYFCIFPWKVLI